MCQGKQAGFHAGKYFHVIFSVDKSHFSCISQKEKFWQYGFTSAALTSCPYLHQNSVDSWQVSLLVAIKLYTIHQKYLSNYQTLDTQHVVSTTSLFSVSTPETIPYPAPSVQLHMKQIVSWSLSIQVFSCQDWLETYTSWSLLQGKMAQLTQVKSNQDSNGLLIT